MKHIILVNPFAGKRNNIKYGERIKLLLKKYDIESEIYTSDYPGNIGEIVNNLIKENTCRFYIVGGDGTINEVASKIVNTSSEIVLIPAGTGNDLVKTVSKYQSLRKIIRESINKKSQKIDIIKVNDKYCINISSVGFDSLVGKNVDIFKKFPFLTGKGKYNMSIFYSLIENLNFDMDIYINNQKLNGSYTLVAISNGKYYGGGIVPNPTSNIQDGLFNVCTITKTSVIDKLILLPKYQKGTHSELKQVKHFTSENLVIHSKKDLPVSIDGEIFYAKKLDFKLLKDAINILII